MWDTFIRTDSNIISKAPKKTDGSDASGGPNLNNVDAIFFMGHRDVPLDAAQKEELLSFVREGKGFVAAHVALTAFESWPEFGELIGARFDQHPISGPRHDRQRESRTSPRRSTSRRRSRSTTSSISRRSISREKIDVVLRLDLTNVPSSPALRLNGDYPLAWAKTYGKGRVFYGSFAHASADWDIRDVQQMYFEAMRWALGLRTPSRSRTRCAVSDSLTGEPSKASGRARASLNSIDADTRPGNSAAARPHDGERDVPACRAPAPLPPVHRRGNRGGTRRQAEGVRRRRPRLRQGSDVRSAHRSDRPRPGSPRAGAGWSATIAKKAVPTRS